jgi:tRNA-(ms[2]io[6]A)-hydroxylase
MPIPTEKLTPLVASVLDFLPCRTPSAWVAQALADVETLLLDHASLELKAAEQAQKLIRKHGSSRGGADPDAGFRSRLVVTMSRLAREELRHFEQVVGLIESRGRRYETITPSRYATGLHQLARKSGPGELVDALIVGAVIEARSCERFFSLVEAPALEESIRAFYASLLKSEARHFEDYLRLAEALAGGPVDERAAVFLERDRSLIESADTELRFHSGPKRQRAAEARSIWPGNA